MGWTIRDSASSGASPSPTLSWADSPALSWAEARAAASNRTAVSASRIGAQHTGDPPPCVQYEFLHTCRVVNGRTLARGSWFRESANESWYIPGSLPGALRVRALRDRGRQIAKDVEIPGSCRGFGSLFPRRLPHQTFLGDARHQPPGPIVDEPPGEAASVLGGRALHRIKQPFIDTGGPVEPHRVIDAGDDHGSAEPTRSVRPQRGGHQVVVRGIGQHAGVQERILRHPVDGAEPDLLARLGAGGLQRVPGLDRAEVDRRRPPPRLATALGHRVSSLRQPLLAQLRYRAQRLGRWNGWRWRLVLEPGLQHVKRSDHGEDRLSVLDGLHPAGGEAAPVADAIDFVDPRRPHVAGT